MKDTYIKEPSKAMLMARDFAWFVGGCLVTFIAVGTFTFNDRVKLSQNDLATICQANPGLPDCLAMDKYSNPLGLPTNQIQTTNQAKTPPPNSPFSWNTKVAPPMPYIAKAKPKAKLKVVKTKKVDGIDKVLAENSIRHAINKGY